MTPFKALRLVAMVFVVFAIFYALFDQPHAGADPDKVYVDPSMPNASRIESRISARLTDADDIRVWVEPQRPAHDDPPPTDQLMVVWAHGDVVKVYGNDWVPQAVLDDMLYRTQNVNRNPIDTVMGVIQLIHEYQQTHEKPAPPPPPPPPPAPPTPPGPPWYSGVNWLYVGIGIPTIALVVFLIIQAFRRRAHRQRLARNAEVQADWGVDDYGIKSTID